MSAPDARPGVVRVDAVPAEERPRFLRGEGVASRVRRIGDAAGLRQMGVSIRTADPGRYASNRHFHEVEEEWAYVLSGTGTARLGPHAIAVRAGHFVGYPPGPRAHDFLATGSEPLVLLEGGERRPDEERGWYPDLGKGWSKNGIEDRAGPPPPDESRPEQCVHLDDCEVVAFAHPVEPRARRRRRDLAEPTGLVRQAVVHVVVQPGDLTTAFHTHTRTDEWVYVLQGRARVRLGDGRFEVGAGDFLAHPAGSPPHAMEALEELHYLMGGQCDADDTVLYPEHGRKLQAGRFSALEP